MLDLIRLNVFSAQLASSQLQQNAASIQPASRSELQVAEQQWVQVSSPRDVGEINTAATLCRQRGGGHTCSACPLVLRDEPRARCLLCEGEALLPR